MIIFVRTWIEHKIQSLACVSIWDRTTAEKRPSLCTFAIGHGGLFAQTLYALGSNLVTSMHPACGGIDSGLRVRWRWRYKTCTEPCIAFLPCSCVKPSTSILSVLWSYGHHISFGVLYFFAHKFTPPPLGRCRDDIIRSRPGSQADRDKGQCS